ncbi:MAG TPA: beta-L-arabinofuranosidase domain-containing protein [Vicinamibacterales bacterium]|nr:beta-L-arabinofuranosidase domain-containing protein [Vicinamibacterales bacterium]
MRGASREVRGARPGVRGAKKTTRVLCGLSVLVVFALAAPKLRSTEGETGSVAPDYPITPVPASQVTLTGGFWAPRLDTNRRVTIPHIMRENETTGRVDNFRKAAHQVDGAYTGRRFNDTDVYKILEAASLSLKAKPDPALEKKVDDLIALIAAAQEPDGYLFPARTIDPKNPAPGVGPERWALENGSHELYNAGHLYEAAVAHFASTGKRTLLDVAVRNADLVAATFGPNGRHAVPGHEEIEVGLVKLFRVTGDRKYLDTAKFFIDERGKPHPDMQNYPDGPFAMYNERPYKQDQEPFVDQTRAVGHAVRAVYLYMGAADVSALTSDKAYGAALDRLWEDMASKRMYLTGGIGARGTTESFGEDYELPNRRAYTETCASVGSLLWGHRMFLLRGDAKYLDVLEQVLYNGYLSGVSLSGDRFFYQNPLESAGRTDRSAYFDVACCPANLARAMEQIPGLLYSTRGSDLFVNLYAASTASIATPAGPLRVKEATRYPWDGVVSLTIDVDKPRAFAVNLRAPSWMATTGAAVPGDLYRFADKSTLAARLTVNGRPAPLKLSKGFVTVSRTWKKGDVVRLDMPMPVRRIVADARVSDDVGKVAIQRGPIVYALEGIDNGGTALDKTLTNAPMSHEYRPTLLGGVEIVRGRGTQSDLTFIPYYAWDNRGAGEMAVWVPAASTTTTTRTSASAGKTMAITFDDLPKAQDVDDLDGARRTTDAILRTLKAHRAPAVAFVNEGKLYIGPRIVEGRVALLQSWIDAGVPLGNHTYSHIDINSVPLAKYEADVVRGERTSVRLMRGTRMTERWFRHPYTHTGPTAEIKAGLDKFLAARGYRVAPFTIENSDWIFSSVYAKAKKGGDEALLARTRDAYLAYTDTMLDWFETLAAEDFGHAIPQILLIHSNELHTDALDALLTRIEQRGYRFVSLGDAMKDAAYKTPDDFTGTYGPSWLHRWRIAKNLPPRMKDEPDPPQWVVDMSK